MNERSRVLVVDDDAGTLAEISALLEHVDCSVIPLATPIGLTRTAQSTFADVILLNLRVPWQSCERLALMLRKTKALADLPIALVSPQEQGPPPEALRRIPGLVFLTKDHLRQDLARVITDLAVGRRLGASNRGVAPRVDAVARRDDAANERAASRNDERDRVSTAIDDREAPEVALMRQIRLWREARSGSTTAQSAFNRGLSDMCFDHAHDPQRFFFDICTALQGVMRTLHSGKPIPPSVSGAVLAALNLMMRLARNDEAQDADEVAAVIWRLASEMEKTLHQRQETQAPPVSLGLRWPLASASGWNL